MNGLKNIYFLHLDLLSKLDLFISEIIMDKVVLTDLKVTTDSDQIHQIMNNFKLSNITSFSIEKSRGFFIIEPTFIGNILAVLTQSTNVSDSKSGLLTEFLEIYLTRFICDYYRKKLNFTIGSTCISHYLDINFDYESYAIISFSCFNQNNSNSSFCVLFPLAYAGEFNE